jgi:hypothetical protein
MASTPEDEPLLGKPRWNHPDRSGTAPQESSTATRGPKGFSSMRLGIFNPQNTRLVLCTFSVFTVAGFSGMLLDVPIVRLFEKIACQDYYAALSNSTISTPEVIDEDLCKLVPIQSTVATLIGWKGAFDSIPGRCTLYRI